MIAHNYPLFDIIRLKNAGNDLFRNNIMIFYEQRYFLLGKTPGIPTENDGTAGFCVEKRRTLRLYTVRFRVIQYLSKKKREGSDEDICKDRLQKRMGERDY